MKRKMNESRGGRGQFCSALGCCAGGWGWEVLRNADLKSD